ncbi:amino acid permease-domain-containing protein [Aspergillus karnatakaensis]|uniref:APC family permease n=1 Tax=Aspergillus karnatakaensis TaxID=1810916 RepID=UPI003CCDCB9F
MSGHADPEEPPHHRASSDIANSSSIREKQQLPLNTLDVACLIINKMIGGGIFVSPSIVAHLTGNKMAALGLWLFGGVYSFCSIYIYLEYGLAWPYNGGEFIYIAKIFPVPPLLFATCYAWFFVAFATSTSNALTFARYINPDKAEDNDEWFVKFFACLIVVAICGVHYRLVNIGIIANNTLAVLKVVLLGVLVLAGLVKACREGIHGSLAGKGDFTANHGNASATNIALAILQVLYSYQGWENANYVTSEIEGDKRRVLKKGALIAVSVVVTLYISFNLFVFLVLDFNVITDGVRNLTGRNVTADFAIQVFGSSNTLAATRAIYVCIALTAAGNLVGVTFTNARVNRDIAQYRVIPFFKFFGRSSKYGIAQWDNLGTPAGGLVLQALITCITIASVNPFRTTLTMYPYGHAIVCFILGIGARYIPKRMDEYETKSADRLNTGYDTPYRFQVMKHSSIRNLVIVFFTIINTFLIITPFIPSDTPEGEKRDTPSWVQPLIVTGVYIVGALVALYILVYGDIRFKGSRDWTDNTDDEHKFVDYNYRRWVIKHRDWRTAVRSVHKPRSKQEVLGRLKDNGEARTARELRRLHSLEEIADGDLSRG